MKLISSSLSKFLFGTPKLRYQNHQMGGGGGGGGNINIDILINIDFLINIDISINADFLSILIFSSIFHQFFSILNLMYLSIIDKNINTWPSLFP